MIFTGIIVSFYYFPFEFAFLPGLNTKMGLAVIGIALAATNLLNKREALVPKNLINIEVFAMLISVVGVVSVTFNNTSDYAYATYFVSMTVWLSGAYTVCTLIKSVHKTLTVENVTAYLTVVCVLQCIMALVINSSPVIKNIVDSFILQDQTFLNEVDRLYGIGASLDTAGVRFSACLILLVYTISQQKDKMSKTSLALAIVSYLWITLAGNMIARTTIVGVGLSLFYALVTFNPERLTNGFLRIVRIVLMILVIVIPLSRYLYGNNLQFYELTRFAFEGFFSWAETGQWEIDSNEKLKSMIVLPDNIKTWIIGDGYFDNPYFSDPTYIGPFTGGYYKGTDIGYLRFIFYFGLIGLVTFACFFMSLAKECASLLPKYKPMILFILLLGFIIWMKVSTDVFLVFALLLCIGNMQDETPQLEEEV